MSKYSQGEWRACCLDNKPHFIFAGEDKTICSMFCNDKGESGYESMEGIITKEECVANAKLIQSAPDLFESLTELFNLLEKNEPNWYLQRHYKKAFNALRKAKSK